MSLHLGLICKCLVSPVRYRSSCTFRVYRPVAGPLLGEAVSRYLFCPFHYGMQFELLCGSGGKFQLSGTPCPVCLRYGKVFTPAFHFGWGCNLYTSHTNTPSAGPIAVVPAGLQRHAVVSSRNIHQFQHSPIHHSSLLLQHYILAWFLISQPFHIVLQL